MQSVKTSLQKSSETTSFQRRLPDAVIDHRSDFALPIWEYLTEKVGERGEVIQTEIAEAVGCSRRTVIKVLKAFKRCNLIDWESYQGQGRGIQMVNLWLRKAKELANSVAWGKAWDAERKYLKDRWTRDGQLGVNRLEGIRIRGQTESKERHPAFTSNKNLTKAERRKEWLANQDGFAKTSSEEGFQKVLLWDLRTSLEERGAEPNATKAVCDSFWNAVKDKPLAKARHALKELNNNLWKLASEMEDVVEHLRDCYKVATKFIKYTILELPGFIGATLEPETVTAGSSPRTLVRRPTPETHREDVMKAEQNRDKGASGIISKILNADSFSLDGNAEEDPRSERYQKIYDTYGEEGLRSWCKGHGVSFPKALESVDKSQRGGEN